MWPPTQRSLSDLRGPTRARVSAVVASQAEVTSPITDRRAAFIQWYFSARRTLRSGDANRRSRDEFRLVALGSLAERLMLEVDGLMLVVPTAGVRFVFAGGWEGEPVAAGLPPKFDPVRHQLERAKGILCYGERTLACGERVEVRGWVAPLAMGGGYRAPAGAAFEVRPDLGRAVVLDATAL